MKPFIQDPTKAISGKSSNELDAQGLPKSLISNNINESQITMAPKSIRTPKNLNSIDFKNKKFYWYP